MFWRHVCQKKLGWSLHFSSIDMNLLSVRLSPTSSMDIIASNSSKTYLYKSEQNQNFVEYSLQFFFWSTFISSSKFLIEKLCNQFSRSILLLGDKLSALIFWKENIGDGNYKYTNLGTRASRPTYNFTQLTMWWKNMRIKMHHIKSRIMLYAYQISRLTEKACCTRLKVWPIL